MEAKQSYIDAYTGLIVKLKNEAAEYNKQVQAINDSVFEQVEDLNRQVEEINEVLGELRATGTCAVKELRRRAEDEGLNVDDSPTSDIIESWQALSEIEDMDTCDGLEVEEIYHLTGRRGLLKDVDPLTGPPSEGEAMIEQRIKALQAELHEARKKRSLKP